MEKIIDNICEVIYSGLPIIYRRNNEDTRARDIFEYINTDEIKNIFGDKNYLNELTKQELEKLFDIISLNSDLISKQNRKIIKMDKQIENTKPKIENKDRKIKSLSWSKISSFENYRSQFIKQYFAGEPFFETKEIIFGKVMGAILETGGFDFEEVLKVISTDRKGNVEDIPQSKLNLIRDTFTRIYNNELFCENLMNFQFDLYPNYEVYLNEEIESGEQKIKCTGYIDNAPDDLIEIGEFKTGKTAWTQEKAENHGQITFYAMMIENKTGTLPTKAKLHWILTENDIDGYIIPTGEIKTFEVNIDPKKVKKMRDKLHIIFDEMQEEYEKWLLGEEGKIELKDDIFIEYAELERQKKAIDEKQKILKKNINEELQKKQVENYKIEGVGTFYYTKKYKWNYGEEIKNKESEIQEELKEKMIEIDIMKKEFEEKNIPEVSLTLACRIV